MDDFNVPPLSAAQSPEAFEVHLAAVEFALANAITIRDQDDIRSRSHWSETLEPFEHQVRNLITFCRRAPAAVIADDVGLGKTISAGLILSELTTRRKVDRTLIVAPKILLPQWRSELKSKFKIESDYAAGREVLSAVRGRSPVVITTYHAVRDYIDAIREAGFDLAIFDEAHKLKSLYGSKQTAKWAKVIRKAVGDGAFRYSLFMTATPIQNSPWDLYSLIDLVAAASRHNNPFGDPAAFEATYLAAAKGRFAPPTLRSTASGRFREVISRYTMRVSRGTSRLPFPGRVVRLEEVAPTSCEKAMLELILRDLARLNPLERVSLASAMMSSPSAFAAQVEKRSKVLPELRPVAVKARAIALGSPTGCKAQHLIRLLDNLRDRAGDQFRAVVFTTRRETQAALAAELVGRGMKVGLIRGGQSSANQATIDAFNRPTPEVNVIVSTEAGSEGVNLQVSNVVVNYDLPWNPMVVEQRIGRVQRLGSNAKNVVVYNLAVRGSIEQTVVTRLLHKLQTITEALGDLEAILEAAGGKGNDVDIGKDIRELVQKALEGQDVEVATRKIEEEIERGKQLYAKERATVTETLGSDLDAIHKAGPPPPNLEPVRPRMGIRAFVRTAYQVDGAVVNELPDGRLRVQLPGERPFTATFDSLDAELQRPSILTGAAGANFRLFAEGSKPFEHLVGAWAMRRTHAVYDVRSNPYAERSLNAICRDWLKQFGEDVELDGMRVVDRDPRFAGTITIKTTASVKHDRIERLISVPVGDPGVGGAPEGADTDLYREPIQAREFVPELDPLVRDAARRHADIARFAVFYEQRRDEERQRVSTPEVKRMVDQDYTPVLAHDIQGATGALRERVRIAVSFTIDGHGPYTAPVTIDIGRVTSEPEAAGCTITGRTVPAVALEACSVTGQRALRHLLVASAKSERLGLPACMERCGVTGAALLTDELATCEITGVRADRDLLEPCAITGQVALRTQLKTCAFTKEHVLPELIEISQISGRPGRSDQMVASSVSGRRGHRSEFISCAETQRWILPEESAVSDASSLRVRADLLVASEKSPHLKALERETVRCAITQRRLLINETEASAVSGKRADRDEIAYSDVSRSPALPDELVQCAVTQARLLPSESGVCAETGRRVKNELIGRNDLTGEANLRSLLITCPETGHAALERQFARCAATGHTVDPSVTVRCTQTNTIVLKRLTVTCEECRHPLLRTEARVTSNMEHAHPEHVYRCPWTGKTLLIRDTYVCPLTGVRLSCSAKGNSASNAAHNELVHLVSSKRIEHSEPSENLRRAFAAHQINIRRAWISQSSATGLQAVIAEQRSGLFGLNRTRYAAFFSSDRRELLRAPTEMM